MWRQIGGGRYYIRSERQGARVVQRYWGSGPAAAAIAAFDQFQAQQKAKALQERHRQRDQLAQITAGLDEGAALIETLMSEALPVLGYRRHRRSQWRKTRMIPTAPAMTEQEAVALFEKGARGDAAARRRAAEILQALPQTREMVSLVALIRKKLGGVIGEPGSMWEDVFAAEASLTAAELAGPDASPLERLAAQQVALAQLSLAVMDHILADLMAQRNFDSLDLFGRHQQRQFNRLQQAIRTLALIRRMSTDLPVNLTEVNIHTDTCHVGEGSPAPLGLEEITR